MVAVQRMRLWASTAHCSQAQLAEKLPGGAVLQPGAFFEVADGELDAGVGPVEGVDVDGGAVEVGEEAEVAPVGPQPGLAGVGQPGAAHDQPPALVGRSRPPGLCRRGCSRSRPRRPRRWRRWPRPRLWCWCARPWCSDTPWRASDREGVVGPEPRVEAHHDLPGRSGPAQPGHQLVDEAAGPPGGVRRAFAHPGVEDLAGVGPGGQDRVVAQAPWCSRRRRPASVLPSTSQIVESTSITSRASPARPPAPRPGPAPCPPRLRAGGHDRS